MEREASDASSSTPVLLDDDACTYCKLDENCDDDADEMDDEVVSRE